MSDCNTVVEKSLYQAVANPEAIQEVITVSFTALVLLEKMDLDFWNGKIVYIMGWFQSSPLFVFKNGNK